jgi:hypothetical protein
MNPYLERLPGDEWHDEIHITTVPRFKTSGLSGDEWRTSAHLEIRRKGILVFERDYHTIRDAAAHLPWVLMTYAEEGVNPKLTEGTCMQPGCNAPATTRYRKLLDGCGQCGSERDATKFGTEKHREFCARHARRGNSNLDDMDERYETISGDGPSGPGKRPVDESPSVLGGIIAT